MGEAFFYHLTRSSLEGALPRLLAAAMGRGWRVVLRGTDLARLEWLDGRLWLDEAGFLPHGLAGGPHDADQPVLLTAGAEIANGAACLMTLDGAPLGEAEVRAMERVCVIFDGNDPAAVEGARRQWKALTEAGIVARYWSEESGRWQLRVAKGG